MDDDIIEDRDLAKEIMASITTLRVEIDAGGNRRIRQQMDEYLTRVYLLARDGHERFINGGK